MPGRAEDPPLITGVGRFVEDFADARTWRAGFVRSHVPHGRITSVDRGTAASEVAAVLLAHDLGLDAQPGKLRESLPGHVDYRRPILADDLVRFEGEGIALVVGRDEATLDDVMETVWVDIDEMPAVIDVESALRDEVVLHPVVGTNRALTAEFGTHEQPRWGAEAEVTLIIESPRVAPLPMEPLSILVRPTPRGIEVVCGTQTPHRLQAAIAEGVRVDPSDVTVIVPEVGGAFGQKGAVYVEYLAVARAAQLLDRPVLWTQRRRDNLRAATHGRGAWHRVRLGGTSDGTLTDAHIEIVGDLGAYPQMGGVVPVTSAAMAPGPYRFERFKVEAVGVLTNRTPTGPYRGAGRPEATFALERAVDAFARMVGVPAHEVRRRSLLEAHADGTSSATGLRYDSGDYVAALDEAVRVTDPDAVREERDRRLARGSRSSIGAAVTCFVERAGGPPQFGEHATVAVTPAGDLELRVGTAPSGQGHRTVFSNIVAAAFDVSSERVRWVGMDTDRIPEGGGTYGSRSGQLGGSATQGAAELLRERCKRLAAELLEASVADIRVAEGRFGVAGVPASGIALAELAAAAVARDEQLTEHHAFTAPAQTFPHGAHGAVVEVDLDTGDVRLLRVVAVDDCGRVLDPMIAEGQVHGSLAQGAGQALHERIALSPDGLLMTATLVDYPIPTASDLPSWEVHHRETPSPTNPLGAKGIGESGTIGLPPAIVNAVLDALEPLGVDDIDMPVTPRNVWKAIERAGGR